MAAATKEEKNDTTENNEDTEKKEATPKVNHIAEALKIAGSLLPFRSETERIEFQDHVTLGGGAQNKDQTAVAKERHDARTEARKEA